MKTFIIAIILLTIIVIGSLAYIYFVNYVTDPMLSELKDLDNTVLAGDWPKAQTQVALLQQRWDKKEGWMKAFIGHAELDQIQITLSRMRQYINFEDTKDFMNESSVLKLLLQSIVEKEKVSLSNLF